MPLVYGFRAMPARAQQYNHPFSGAPIAVPALDILMRQDGGSVVTDRTAYGNNGQCLGCVGARGVFDEGQKFNGVGNTINCGSNPSLDIAQNISAGAWIGGITVAAQAVMAKHNGAAAGWGLFVTAAHLVQAYFNSGAGVVLSANTVRNGLRHVFFTVADTVCRVFVDGLQDGRGAVVMSDSGADSLYIASSRGASNFWEGLIELPQEWSGALSPEQVYKLYLSAGGVPIYYDTFESYAVTPVAKAAGSMCGPVRVLNNPMAITADANGKKWLASVGAVNCYATLTLSDNTAYGTLTHKFKHTAGQDHYFYWTNGATPAGAATNGYAIIITSAGTARVYRITAGVAVAILFNNACVTAVNTEYECKLVRRVGGQTCLYIKGGAFVDWVLVGGPATDNTHTTAGYLIPYLLANGATTDWTLLRVCERPASFPWEFSTGTYAGVVSGSTVWMNCLTAGVTYLPKDLDWQTMILGVRRGAAPNVLDTLFVASEIGSSVAANQNGYVLRVAADGSVQLIRTTGGIEAAPTAQTAAGYTAITTEYEFKINRVWSTNAYEFYVRGGAYATWTLMFAATLGIHISSNYTNWSLTASDRITAPTYYRDGR